VYDYYFEEAKAYMHELINGDIQMDDGLGTEQETQQEGFYIDGGHCQGKMKTPWMMPQLC
jgi:hypothetical protein